MNRIIRWGRSGFVKILMVGSLLTLLFFVSGVAVVMGRPWALNPYGCLNFDANRLVSGKLLDVFSGTFQTLHRPPPAPTNAYYSPVMISRDGKYSLELLPVKNSIGSALYIRPTARGLSDKSIQIEPDGVSAYNWSPDSHHLAYIRVVRGGSYLNIVAPDGSDKHSTLIQALAPYTLLYGWSSDNAYLSVGVNSGLLNIYDTPDLHLVTSIPVTPNYTLVPIWSPKNHTLAVMTNGQQPNMLLFITPETGQIQAYSLPEQRYFTPYQWSPNGDFVVFTYADPLTYDQHVVIYGVNNETWRDSYSLKPSKTPGPIQWYNYWHWSPDDHVFVAMTDTPDGKRTLMALHTDQSAQYNGDLSPNDPYIKDGQTSVLVPDLVKPPFFAQGVQRMAALYHQDGKLGVDIFDLDGGNRTTLVDQADDAGDPYWSPGSQTGKLAYGKSIAVVWATGKGAARVVHLTWANADGSNKHDLDDGFWDVRNLVWSPDGKSLTYAAWHNNGFSVENVDLATGQTHRLAQGFAEVGLMWYGAASELNFWWRLPDNTGGLDIFNMDGTRLKHFRIDAPLTTLTQTRVYFSPNNTAAAFMIGPFGNERFQLAAADGSWTRAVRTHLSSMGDPVWSADSKLIAFTQSIGNKPLTLQIVDAKGNDISAISERGTSYYGLRWTQCN